MTDRDKKMQELVVKEATSLSKEATKEEIKNLNFQKLNSQSSERCIYGQITGDCFSSRAHELIIKCAEKVYSLGTAKERKAKDTLFYNKLNGAPYKTNGIARNTQYFSPIEVFIYIPRNNKNGNNERLINFLKGETKTLKFV